MVNQQETSSSVIGQGGTEDQCDGGTLDLFAQAVVGSLASINSIRLAQSN